MNTNQAHRRTRGAIAIGAVAAVSAAVVVTVALGGPGEPGTRPVVATDPTSSTAASDPLVPDRLQGDERPTLVLGADTGPVDALEGSYCWASGCGDSTIPRLGDMPDVGSMSPLRAAFPLPGQWAVTVSDGVSDPDGCGSYPVLVEVDDPTQLRLTPSGPAGPKVGDFFVRTGGDISGYWRWTVPERDGVPLAWVALTQNSPSSGGEADLVVVMDDAAVDGDVRAAVTATAADGQRTAIATTRVDQHCAGDGFVELGTPYGQRDRQIDGIGPAPYDYQVDLRIDGATYVGTGTWLGDGEEYGGDARLTFDPPLPTLE